MTALRPAGDTGFVETLSAARRRAAGRGAAVTPNPLKTSAPYHPRDGSLDLLIENVAEILNSEVALYCRLDAPGQPPEVICSWGVGTLHDQLARPREGGLVDRALGAQRAVLEPLHPDRDAWLMGSAGPASLTHGLFAPVRSVAATAAVLIAAFSARPPDEPRTVWTAEACAAVLALGAHQPEALEALLQTSSRDGLTGCLNYAGARRELEREINRSTRAGLSLSLAFIDLDDFKRVNDRHGHLRGNDVLRQVSNVLRESVRNCDTIGRFGGDEFIVILPDTDEPQAAQFAARLRSRIAGAAISAVGGPLTTSVGVATWTGGATVDELLSVADQALLRAKAQLHGSAWAQTTKSWRRQPQAPFRPHRRTKV